MSQPRASGISHCEGGLLCKDDLKSTEAKSMKGKSAKRIKDVSGEMAIHQSKGVIRSGRQEAMKADRGKPQKGYIPGSS